MPNFPILHSIPRAWRWIVVSLVGWWGTGLLLLLVGTSCSKPADGVIEPDVAGSVAQAGKRSSLPSQFPEQTSESCRACHADVFAAWSGTDHANANQSTHLADLTEAFAQHPEISAAGSTFRLEMKDEGPVMSVVGEDGAETPYPVHAVLGQKPLRQMLLETESGRIQPTDMAWDPEASEWFNVFGDEHRHAGEWGHWTGRGMNWNSMCAHCHMTGYQKNYSAETDRYTSTWVEEGISCIQCHGPVDADHGSGSEQVSWIRDRQRSEQTCAYCHARNEQLTEEFPPGAKYDDHFRLTLPVQAGVFWPDGQQREEDFNWTSVKLSRMHHAGVSCMDCHDPHTSRTILPVENNVLCMQCHSEPGRTMPLTNVVAPVIDPTAHSRHASGSTGNQCVSCHMPTTDYMMRAPRHDHGWLKPDPLMTQELGIPNACNGCHTDESVDWAIAHTTAWYGEKMDSRQRARARAIAAAQAGEERAVDALLKLWTDEDIPAWRATYLQLLINHADHHPEIVKLAREAAEDEDPMVRAAAVQVLSAAGGQEEVIRAGLDDPVRLVRFDAAWALPQALVPGSALAKEFLAYLDLTLDQPGGRMRKGQFLANTGRLDEAVAEMKQATQWDPYAAGIHENHAMVLQAAGRIAEAANAFYRAARLQPTSGEAMFRAGLAYAEARKYPEAETALSTAVKRDPTHHRAWYNLGLLRNQNGEISAALEALSEAEKMGGDVPDYPYAAATIHWQQGDRDAAREAARRALKINPSYAPARRLLE